MPLPPGNPPSASAHGSAGGGEGLVFFPDFRIRQLRERIRSVREGAASALGALAALDGHSNGGRTARIAVLALELGYRIGLPARTIRDLELSALLHDIGFLALPGELRSRRGRLSLAERREVERHPEIGRRILSQVPGFEDAARIVGSHHERPDGRGYPGAVEGEDIPVPARVLAVAEALHAMLTGRSYRSRLALDEAMGRLEQGAGSCYDPAVVVEAGRLAESYERLIGSPRLELLAAELPSRSIGRYDPARSPLNAGRERGD